MRATKHNLTAQGLEAKRRQKGQTLVEFALVAMIFFVILFGLIEFARALWTWNTIAQATRAGARFAVVEAPTAADTEVKNYVVYLNSAGTGAPVLPGLTTSNVTIQYLDLTTNPATVAATLSEKRSSDVVQVRITGYSFSFVLPILGSTLTLPPFTTTLPLEGLGAS